MNTALSGGSRNTPLHSLTGARFVAAAAVVVGHYNGLMQLSSPFLRLAGSAVAFFFVLSGFILTYTYAGRLQSDDRPGYGEFLRARFARVYPVHLFVLLLVTPLAVYVAAHPPVAGVVPPDHARVAASWAANVLLLQSYLVDGLSQNGWNAPAWSVSCEAFFYLAFPFLLVTIQRLRTTRSIVLTALGIWTVAAAATVVVDLIITRLLHRHETAAMLVIYRAPYLRIADFAIGCLAGLWFVRAGPGAWSHRPSREVAVVLALASAFGLVVYESRLGSLAETVVFVPPFAVLVLALASGPTLVSGLLSTRPLRALGEASYSLYLSHWPPMMVLYLLPKPPSVGLIVAVMVGCVGLSLLMYRYVEDPCRRLIRSGRPVRQTASRPTVLEPAMGMMPAAA